MCSPSLWDKAASCTLCYMYSSAKQSFFPWPTLVHKPGSRRVEAGFSQTVISWVLLQWTACIHTFCSSEKRGDSALAKSSNCFASLQNNKSQLNLSEHGNKESNQTYWYKVSQILLLWVRHTFYIKDTHVPIYQTFMETSNK